MTRIPVLEQSGQRREEGSLRLAGCRGCTNQHVLLTRKHDRNSLFLHVAQLIPLLTPYPALDTRIQASETAGGGFAHTLRYLQFECRKVIIFPIFILLTNIRAGGCRGWSQFRCG